MSDPVFDLGSAIASGQPGTVRDDARVAVAYLGRTRTDTIGPRTPTRRAPAGGVVDGKGEGLPVTDTVVNDTSAQVDVDGARSRPEPSAHQQGIVAATGRVQGGRS